MTDLSQFVAPKSDQLNADDLIAGPRTITVTDVKACPGSDEQPIAIYFEGDGGKPFKPCKSMRRVLLSIWGKDGNTYAGRSMTLYRDPKVTFGGLQVGGIRISHATDIDRPVTLALTASKAKRTPYTVQPLSSAPKEDVGAAQSAARAAAKAGSESFRRWWNSDEGKMARDMVRPIIAELQDLAAAADSTEADDPFDAAPEDTPALSPEDEARLLAEIEAEQRKEMEG